MPDPTKKTETATDMRNIGLTRKLLQFADGNTYLLNRSQTIEVTRLPPIPKDGLPAAARRTP